MRKFIIIFALILGICDCFAHSHSTDHKQSVHINDTISANTLNK